MWQTAGFDKCLQVGGGPFFLGKQAYVLEANGEKYNNREMWENLMRLSLKGFRKVKVSLHCLCGLHLQGSLPYEYPWDEVKSSVLPESVQINDVHKRYNHVECMWK